MLDAELRAAIERIVEQLINVLDALDGDPDIEDDDAEEPEIDADEAPVTLNRVRQGAVG